MGRLRAAGGVVFACSLLFLTTGCGERSEPTAATVPVYPATVQGAGERPVTLRAAPRRIAALAEAPTRILTALGAAARVVGGPQGNGLRVVNPNGEILFERLRQVRPDLLVASEATDPVDLRRAARATRTPVYIAPGNSIEDVEQAVSELAVLAGVPLRARRIVAAIEARRRAVAERVADRSPVRVFVDVGFFTTVSDRSLIGDLVREARGRNVAGARPDAGPFPLEELARLDPEAYVATSDSATTLARLRANPRTRGMTAVRERRFETIPVELLQPGPRIGEGLAALARFLHPDAFR